MKALLLLLPTVFLVGCGDDGPNEPRQPPPVVLTPWSYTIHSFTPGTNSAGSPVDVAPFHWGIMNAKIAGPPNRSFPDAPTPFETLQLGNHGEVVLEVTDGYVVDEAGPDFIVFENVIPLTGGALYGERGIVSVAEVDEPGAYRTFLHLAGAALPEYSPERPIEAAGGDQFDLSEIHLQRARFIKIRDAGGNSYSTCCAGFDLDAIAIIHIAAQ